LWANALRRAAINGLDYALGRDRGADINRCGDVPIHALSRNRRASARYERRANAGQVPRLREGEFAVLDL